MVGYLPYNLCWKLDGGAAAKRETKMSSFDKICLSGCTGSCQITTSTAANGENVLESGLDRGPESPHLNYNNWRGMIFQTANMIYHENSSS